MKKVIFAAVAALGLSAVAAVPYKLGIAGYMFAKGGLDWALDVLEQIDSRYLCHKDFMLPYDATDEQIAAFKAKLAAKGVTCLATGPLYVTDEASVRRQFDFAKRYGMKVVVGVPYDVAADGKTRVESDRMLDIIDRLVKEYDIRYAIHNHGPDIPYLFPTGQKSWDMVKDLDERMGLCLDVGHDFRAKADPVDSIRKFHSRIYDMHIKNVKFDPVKNRAMPMPRGDMDMWAIVKALVEVGYTGVCSLEYESFPPKGEKPGIKAEEVAESIGYFKGLMKAAGC
jgi:sugar phosphate isomerase/epimerase